ncbi:hypothetical protein SFRURICE_003278 [Spodoptera frugiperda]|uniref:SFRICE_038767 n=1 Tax=Spodoptera frugiperda TaxID=7108 RepID=A0A2H1X1G2_SPOFR|nr:hypothetical protein SFRURICE_003278 [Spodoptera frugiperda]
MPSSGIVPGTCCTAASQSINARTKLSHLQYQRYYNTRVPYIYLTAYTLSSDSALLLKILKAEKNPAVLRPTRESNPRPLDRQLHLQPLGQRDFRYIWTERLNSSSIAVEMQSVCLEPKCSSTSRKKTVTIS